MIKRVIESNSRAKYADPYVGISRVTLIDLGTGPGAPICLYGTSRVQRIIPHRVDSPVRLWQRRVGRAIGFDPEQIRVGGEVALTDREGSDHPG